MPEPMTRKSRGPSAAGRADTLLPIQVRYYKRMHRGKTYPVQVNWKRAERGVAARTVTLRLEVAGALVVPAEQFLRPADPESKATFYVTPLGRGKLRHQVLEIYYQDAKIHEMPLKAKVGTQKFTLFLLLMTFFAPWVLTTYCKTPIQRGELESGKESMIALLNESLPDLSELENMLKDWFSVKEWVNAGVEFLGSGYGDLCTWCNEYPIATYTGLALFGLTLISAWWHKAKRKWRTSIPIPLPE